MINNKNQANFTSSIRKKTDFLSRNSWLLKKIYENYRSSEYYYHGKMIKYLRLLN